MAEEGRGPVRRMLGVAGDALRRARATAAPADRDAPGDGGGDGDRNGSTVPAERPGAVDRKAPRLSDREVLLASPLFDAEWYSLVSGVDGDREHLVRHYLATAPGQRPSPQPLFDPDWFRRSFSGDVGDRDPFLVYLRRRAWATPTHPLFATALHRRTVPGAKEHPYGPLAHHLEAGAATGAPAHRWLQGEGGEPAVDARAFVLERWRARLARSSRARPDRGSIDWAAEAARERDPALISVVIAAGSDWESSARAVRRVLEHSGQHPTQVVVLSHDGDAVASLMLDALALHHPGVDVRYHAGDLGPALGPAAALPQVRGSTVVLLDPRVEVGPGWLDPLVAALGEREVLGVQPLLLHPDRTVRCAGLAFTRVGASPHAFLQGFPPEDAQGIDLLTFQALSGACLAVRTAEFVELRGFDDRREPAHAVDLCLRLRASRAGRFMVRPDSTVVLHPAVDAQPRPGVGDAAAPAAAVAPEADAADLWASRGFRVVEPETDSLPGRSGAEEAAPRLVRIRPTVTEAAPRLRWAIKNPATPGPYGDRWGDTHFAAALATALRSLGQDVVIDRRDAFHRSTAHHDDVNLVLRGLTPFLATPGTGTVTLGWVISHPEEVTPEEVRTWDRALAASVHWAQERTRDWGIEVEALLQATDPARFHPDLAEPDTGHPVLFVGSSRKQYRPMVRDAVEQGLPLAVYGTEWEGILPAEFLAATYLPNDRLGAAYGAAGVVLNDHWEDMRLEGFLSNRLFDAVASGARVISDEVSGLGDLFGRSVQVARTPRELVDLSSAADRDAVFGEAAERRAVAERVRREHSFTARAEHLLDVAVAVRTSRGLGL